MTDKQQPEALRLANALEYCDASVARQAINELLRQHAELETLRTGYAAARLEIESLREKYNELIFAVGMKYPGETRHETAMRYIKKAEEPAATAQAKTPDNAEITGLSG